MNNFIINILRRILLSASEPMREMLVKFATDFRTRARETSNPWDDVLADLICLLLQVNE